MSHVDSAKADAYHEAGHAVAAVVLGTGLVDVDIRSQRSCPAAALAAWRKPRPPAGP